MTKNFVQQAPQMTQMIAPDIAAQQVALQRQQQLADLLKQQGMAAPEQTQVISGVAVKQSPLIGLSKMLQAYMGGKMQSDNDAKSLELGKLLQGRMGDILGGSSAPNYSLDPNGTGGAMPGQLGSGMADTGDAPQGTGAPILPSGGLPVVPPAGAVPQAPPNNFTMANLLKGQTIEALGGNSAAGAYWDQYKTPDAVKTMDLTGQDRMQMGRYAAAAARKGGMLEMQPGNTVLDLVTNGKTVAPDFKLGIAGGYGANGQPTMNRINGSEVIPQMAGDIKRAESMGAAGAETIVVDTPDGKVLKTKEQAAKEAQQIGASGLDLTKLTAPQIAALAKQDPNAFAEGVANFQRTSNKQSGIPLKSDEAKEFGSSIAKGAGDDLLKGRDNARTAESALHTIQESRKAIAGGAFLGSGADAKTDITKAAKSLFGIDIDSTKLSNSEYLRTTLGQGLLDNAKKLGANPTAEDSKRIDAIVGTISKDPTALSKALDFQEEMAIRAINKHNENVTDAERRGLSTPFNLTIQVPKFEKLTPPVQVNQASNIAPKNIQSILDKYK